MDEIRYPVGYAYYCPLKKAVVPDRECFKCRYFEREDWCEHKPCIVCGFHEEEKNHESQT